MDPITYEHLLYNLRSEDRRNYVPVPVTSLQRGTVLATRPHDRHVVVSAPVSVSEHYVQLVVRSLDGGHNLRLKREAGGVVDIYRDRLMPSHLARIPLVPKVFVPDHPETGDRIVHHHRQGHGLADVMMYHYDGTQWTRSGTREHDMRRLVGLSTGFTASGWFTYLPAGQSPYLYVDGLPLPARTVEGLLADDVIRTAGGGRLTVWSMKQLGTVTTVTVQVTRVSTHEDGQRVGAASDGAWLEFHDAGTGALYPTEPRANELLPAPELVPGDVAITAYGTPRAAVAHITNVMGQPLSGPMHVYSTTPDDVEHHTVTGLHPQYVVLRRTAAQAFAA